MTRREIGFLVLVAVGFVRVGSAAVVQDHDADSLRASYEVQFESFDDNDDGQLDASELANVPGSDLADMHAHGLPATVPVSREAFVASGVATALAAIAGSDSDMKKEMDDKRSRDVSKPTREEPDQTKSTETKTLGTTAATPATRFPGRKSHYVPELPAEFVARDKNGDGQIAMYEWDRKKYSEFAKLDKNGDGFLTPAELLPAEVLKGLYTKTTGRPGTAVAGGGSAGAGGTPGDDIDKEARNTFGQMDQNRNSMIDEDEWSRSSRIRPSFERANIKATIPMNVEAFVPLFRRSKETERTERAERPERSDRR